MHDGMLSRSPEAIKRSWVRFIDNGASSKRASGLRDSSLCARLIVPGRPLGKVVEASQALWQHEEAFDHSKPGRASVSHHLAVVRGGPDSLGMAAMVWGDVEVLAVWGPRTGAHAGTLVNDAARVDIRSSLAMHRKTGKHAAT